MRRTRLLEASASRQHEVAGMGAVPRAIVCPCRRRRRAKTGEPRAGRPLCRQALRTTGADALAALRACQQRHAGRSGESVDQEPSVLGGGDSRAAADVDGPAKARGPTGRAIVVDKQRAPSRWHRSESASAGAGSGVGGAHSAGARGAAGPSSQGAGDRRRHMLWVERRRRGSGRAWRTESSFKTASSPTLMRRGICDTTRGKGRAHVSHAAGQDDDDDDTPGPRHSFLRRAPDE